MLILVRHSMPAVRPEVAPELWELGEAGRRDAEALVDVLPPGAVLVAGTEPKMRQTLEPAGLVSTTLGLADPGEFWAALRLPDVYEIRPGDGTVTRAV